MLIFRFTHQNKATHGFELPDAQCLLFLSHLLLWEHHDSHTSYCFSFSYWLWKMWCHFNDSFAHLWFKKMHLFSKLLTSLHEILTSAPKYTFPCLCFPSLERFLDCGLLEVTVSMNRAISWLCGIWLRKKGFEWVTNSLQELSCFFSVIRKPFISSEDTVQKHKHTEVQYNSSSSCIIFDFFHLFLSN